MYNGVTKPRSARAYIGSVNINPGLSGEAENYDIWQISVATYSMLLSAQTNCCVSYIPASDFTL